MKKDKNIKSYTAAELKAGGRKAVPIWAGLTLKQTKNWNGSWPQTRTSAAFIPTGRRRN